jgi:hypothetical protein
LSAALLIGLAATLLALLTLVGLALRGGLYRRIHQPGFLRELRDALARAKVAALASQDQLLPPPEALASGAAFVLAPGLAVVYTVRSEQDQLVHHLSISYRGGGFARAAAAYLASAICHLLRPQGPVALGVAESGVYHLQFVLEPDAHAAYAAEPLAELDEPAEQQLAAAAREQSGGFLEGLVQVQS